MAFAASVSNITVLVVLDCKKLARAGKSKPIDVRILFYTSKGSRPSWPIFMHYFDKIGRLRVFLLRIESGLLAWKTDKQHFIKCKIEKKYS